MDSNRHNLQRHWAIELARLGEVMGYLILIAIAILLAMMAACAPTIYRHPTNPAADFARDKADCNLYAHQASAWTVQSLGFPNPFIWNQEFKRCLTDVKGWRAVEE